MFQQKAVRSALVLLSLSGMLAACSSNSGSGEQPAPVAPAAGSILSQSNVQTAEVKIASVTDAEGHAVPMDTSAVLTQLAAVKQATVTREAYQGDDGAAAERMVIDLGDENGSIVRFQSGVDFSNLAVSTGGFPCTAASATTEEGRITEMLLTIEDGRALNVVLSFIEPQGDDSKQDAKQDEPKQDEQKKDEPKQDEPKQDEPKKDQPKQDQPKQDQPKKEEPKKEEPKQDQPKQDQPKQDEKKG